jgi:hypothetical protein
VVSALAAVIGAGLLAGLVYLVQRRRGSVRKRWILGAVLLPFLTVAYMWAAFAAYGVHCEAIRDVDLGLGDSWRVPLTRGYTLTMIDTPQQAFVRAPGGGQSHLGLTRIGATERFVALEDEGRFFLLDARSGSELLLRTEPELQAALRASGDSHLSLLPPGEFYDTHRWGGADAVAAGFAVFPPTLAFIVFMRRFVRSRRPEAD